MILALLQKIVKGLDFSNIDYMLSGSVAMGIYTLPRMTMDIDIVVGLNLNNTNDFIGIFKESFYIDIETVKEEIKRKGMFNVIDHETGYKIDFIVRKDSEYRRLEFNRRRKTNIGGSFVWIVSPEDLVISKIEWIQQLQSPKQINDITNLLNSQGIDKAYIKKWCKLLKLDTFKLI